MSHVSTMIFQTSKRGKFSFEIQMQDRSGYLLAAETEQELDEWLKTLKKVIAANETTNMHSPSIDRLREKGEY